MRSLTAGLIIRSSSLPFTYTSSSLYKRFHFLKPCSSLKQTKQKQQSLPPSTAPPPQTLRCLFSPKSSDDAKSSAEESDDDGDAALKGAILAGVGYVYRDQINTFLTQFSTLIEGYGPAGYALFIAVYAGLEASFLTLSSMSLSLFILTSLSFKALFVFDLWLLDTSHSGSPVDHVGWSSLRWLGMLPGSWAYVSAGAFGRAIIQEESNVGLPGGNGQLLTLGWLGMLPGSWAYVSAGAFGRAIIQEESNVGLPGGNGQLLTLGLGLLVTALAATYVTRLAKDAIKDIDDE
ncbi:hypothetical protein F2Q69_00054529 [Brassica cretica]|uniref:Uncharacterized protein n=1 Tax=Brassica cretica TaxID=69181 RepID=A0A8S9MYG3_BRACR|nr:hypothetical protein F2Q69_00054529 [Brassica cretica]